MRTVGIARCANSFPRQWALAGRCADRSHAELHGIYGFFMNETLLLTLTARLLANSPCSSKAHVGAFICACIVWLAASFTRIVVWPVAILCLLWLVATPPRDGLNFLLGAGLFVLIAVPQVTRARNLGYFSPFGNLYLNTLYRQSAEKTIELDFGPKGRYWFGSPSFYNPDVLSVF